MHDQHEDGRDAIGVGGRAAPVEHEGIDHAATGTAVDKIRRGFSPVLQLSIVWISAVGGRLAAAAQSHESERFRGGVEARLFADKVSPTLANERRVDNLIPFLDRHTELFHSYGDAKVG